MPRFKLHGELATAIGRDEWEINTTSVAEGLRIIEANTERLYVFLYQAEEGKAEYRVLINGKDHTDVLELQTERDDLLFVDIIPVLQGAASWWKIVIGVVLLIVAVAMIASGWGSPGGVGIATFAIGFMLSSGLSLVMGGIAELLAPSPNLGGGVNTRLGGGGRDKLNTDTKESKPNYLFSGTVNTTSQGNCVPLLYGRYICGSQLVSFGLFSFAIPKDVVIGENATLYDQDDDFEGLQMWHDLSNSLLIQPYDKLKDMQKLGHRKTEELARKFKIVRDDTNIPRRSTLRNYLETVFFVFRGPRLSKISKKEAWQLYKRLNLDNGTNLFEGITPYKDKDLIKEDIIYELGQYYLTLI